MKPEQLVDFIREIYKTKNDIPLHAPKFLGNEKKYVLDTLESTYVSSVGKFVDDFEKHIEKYTGTQRAVATVNGTAALHVSLYMSGVSRDDFVITQSLSFVATCNAIYQIGAEPIFVDVSPISMGICPKAIDNYLHENAVLQEHGCIHKKTRRRIPAVVAMHTFGHPAELDEIVAVCKKWKLILIEDAAESLGSFYKNMHTGTFGKFGALSFNGNKVVTTGGGGMVLCSNSELGLRVKHITTTAKIPHPYEFIHDEPGFNYRLPNLNAALGCGQIEFLPIFIQKKRKLANLYKNFFIDSDYIFFEEPHYAQSNYWLNAILCPDESSRNTLLEITNRLGIMTRPIWKLLHKLPMFSNSLRDDLSVSQKFESVVINLPSSPI